MNKKLLFEFVKRLSRQRGLYATLACRVYMFDHIMPLGVWVSDLDLTQRQLDWAFGGKETPYPILYAGCCF